MRQLTQSGGTVDGWAHVVARIAQLHLAGVQTDSQPDRCQRCPLQIQRACYSVGRPGERDDEAVAFTLLYRTHAAVGADQLGQRVIQVGYRCAHLVGSGLPKLGGAFHIGQEQCHGAGR